jgi:hypothetical protein
MDINEAKSFLIVMGFLCFITTSISFYNFTKNKQFLRSQINDDASLFQSDFVKNKIAHDIDDYVNYYQKEINDIDDVVVSDIFIQEQLKYNN